MNLVPSEHGKQAALIKSIFCQTLSSKSSYRDSLWIALLEKRMPVLVQPDIVLKDDPLDKRALVRELQRILDTKE